MPVPIILTAFGTSSPARSTYDSLEAKLQSCFPNREIHWGYTSGKVGERLRDEKQAPVRRPDEILAELARDGHTSAIVQSLHLLAGQEFHRLHREVEEVAGVDCAIGMPLLSSYDDFLAMASLLAPVIEPHPERAVLLIGHGTRHPAWTAWPALEHMLRQRFGSRVFVGVIGNWPVTDGVEEAIAAAGFREVLLIPFLLVAGRHFQRDMIGEAPHSWSTRLKKKGLRVEVVEQGLGLLPGIESLVARHIHAAQESLRRANLKPCADFSPPI